MSTTRPLVVAFGPGGRRSVEAHALAAALPGATLLRLGPPPRRARGRVDPDMLWRWLAGDAPRPVIRHEPPAAPRRTRPAAPPPHAHVLVLGLGPWDGAMPALLAKRADLRPIAVLDWPTAWDWPEYHPARDVEAMRRALAALNAIGSPVIVPSDLAAARFATVPLRVDAVAPEPSWLAGTVPTPDPALAAVPYVVAVGPLEARANTGLLLQLWRDALLQGRPLPKLVLAGARGDQIEEIAPLLDWNPGVRASVAEAPGLPPEALRRLIENARALLVPDVAGPPVALVRDALALYRPVIAAATPEVAHLDIGPRLDPFDGPGWRGRIAQMVAHDPTDRPDGVPLPSWEAYAARIAADGEVFDGGAQKSVASPLTSQSP